MYDQISDRNYQRLARIVEDHAGIRLPPSKRTMVEGRLRKRVRALGLATLDEYCHSLFDKGQLEKEFVHLIDEVTTNKTDFFREAEHFEFLRTQVLPALLSERSHNDRRFKAWSAACSNGAEPYTIAMVLADEGLRFTGLRFSILGTDICTEVLEQAVLGVYPEEMLEPVPAALRERYVMRSRNPTRREARIVPELRSLVRFRRLNLMDSRYPSGRDVDVIFCRNILIYFNRQTQHDVLERLCSHLRPGGYLFLGHSESAAGSNLTQMKPVAASVLRHE
ncbi:MAG: CheR family methyltransferase [Stellaceae bacterium]